MSEREIELLGYTIIIYNNRVRVRCSCCDGYSSGKKYSVWPWRDLNKCIEKSFKHVAMHKMKKLCEKHLMKEANDYHNDMDECHTYDNYVNECQSMIKEMLGQPGYEGVQKELAD